MSTYAKMYNEEVLANNLLLRNERLNSKTARAEGEKAFTMFDYYVAYGSNINGEQMALRCQESKAILPPFLLLGASLRFSNNKHHLGWNGVADLSGIENGGVYKSSDFGEDHNGKQLGLGAPVLLYKITLEDMFALDVFEGYNPHPTSDKSSFYTRAYFSIKLGEKTLRAMTYRMVDGEKAKPDELYVGVIRDGYVQRKMPTEHLDFAVDKGL